MDVQIFEKHHKSGKTHTTRFLVITVVRNAILVHMR